MWFRCRCSTLLFTVIAGLSAAGGLFATRAVEEGVAGVTTAATVVREIAGTALTARDLVEIKADQVLTAGLSGWILVRAVL